MALISCSECKNQVSDKAAACPKCGAPIRKNATGPNPGTAAVLSFLIPGLGHMYVGQIGSGLGLFVVAAVGFAGITSGESLAGFLGALAWLFAWLYGMAGSYWAAQGTTGSAARHGRLAVVLLLVASPVWAGDITFGRWLLAEEQTGRKTFTVDAVNDADVLRSVEVTVGGNRYVAGNLAPGQSGSVTVIEQPGQRPLILFHAE